MLYSVVLTIVIQNNKILLLKRRKGDFINLLAIPGGKIEENEHVSDAAKRELLEESGIESDFKDYLGCVSEVLIQNKEVKAHFILHLCELFPKTIDILNNTEGEMDWYDLDSLNGIKENIIPSDYEMIKNFILSKSKKYFNCVEEKVGNKYYIREFL
ncbi:MAG: NUDIX hydrolase [Candidatus Pacebacteria bacterium]|nr:NUDIX hydrolase [Candidatus Paceibacterota bacterium]